MAIPPALVIAARQGWQWQWQRLMGGLGPADAEGNYRRPNSDHLSASVPSFVHATLPEQQRPLLILGRSCPWAHRTWLVHQLRRLGSSVTPLIARADHRAGRWQLDPPWQGCHTLLELYQHCGAPPSYRATVPVLVDPSGPRILGNESAQLVELFNEWPAPDGAPDLAAAHQRGEIDRWQSLLQPAVNDGVYRCGFARTQAAYDRAETDLFNALQQVEQALQDGRSWLCGDELSLADVRLFPTLIRWEVVYAPLFGCSRQPLWQFPNLWRWRQRFHALPGVDDTCDAKAWRQDYFGALFPLNPGGIVPAGPDLSTLVHAGIPRP